MLNRESALQYARLGWHVFPVYEIKDGVCSCGNANCTSQGKHPRIANGRNGASNIEHIISRWWTDWPNANIGVATGHESNIIVIDQDGHQGEYSLQDHHLPRTVTALTGGGGKHYIYAYPNTYIKSRTNVLESVDSRGDGGYIVVAPSNHISGNVYQWQEGHDPFTHEISEAPHWWLDMMLSDENSLANTNQDRRKYTDNRGEIKLKNGSRNDTIARAAGMMRRAGLPYESILAGCLALPVEEGSDPLPPHEIETTVRSICQYEAGDPIANLGARAIEELLATSRKEKIARLEKIPEPNQIKNIDIVPKRGLALDMIDFILSQSELPQPEIATAVVMTFLGNVIGRKIQSQSGLLTNNAFVCLSDSGTGKDRALSLIKKLATDCNLMSIIGPGKIASGVGVRNLLHDHPSVMLPIDEFGLKLKSITNSGSASHERDIMTTIMEAYSRAQDVDTGTAYADRRLKPPEPIYRPCLGFVGTTTARPFYEAIGSGDGENGFIARFLTIDVTKKEPNAQKVSYMPWPKRIIEAVQKLAKGEGDMIEHLNGSTNPEMPIIPYDTGLEEAIWHFRHRTLKQFMTTESAKSIYSRVGENAIKLALTEAYTSGKKVIDEIAWIWARDLCLQSAHTSFAMLNDHVADTKTESWGKKIIAWIKDAKKEGRTNRQLTQKFQSIEKWQRQQILEDLVEGGTIFKSIEKNAHGPDTIKYVYVNYVEE